MRILVAEDDYLVGEDILRLLKQLGYEVVERVFNGKQAVEKACELQPDVILMDIKMPEMNGLDATKIIQNQCPTPVIILTAHEDKELLDKAGEFGASAFIVKPPSKQEIDRAITIAVARHRDFMKLKNLNNKFRTEIVKRKQAEKHLKINQIHYQFINKLNEKLTKGVPFSTIIKRICNHFQEIHNLEAADIYFLHYDNNQNEYIQIEYSNINDKLLKRAENLTNLSLKKHKIYFFEGSIYKKLYTEKKPIELSGHENIYSLIKDMALPEKKILRKFAAPVTKILNVKNSYMVPIIINNKSIGHLGFIRNNKFDDYTKKTLQMMMIEVANMIERNRLRQLLIDAKEKSEENEKELRKSNLTKDKFFSIIAHDLKSPFNAMLGFSDILVKNFDDYNKEKQKQFLGYIHKSIQSSNSLLNNLLIWSRTQQGRIEFQPQKENLYSLIDETIQVLEQSYENKKIEIDNQVSDKYKVIVDKNMFLTIIRNLISNAIKFTSTGGKIVISAELKKRFTEISIADTGVGISKEVQSKLFDISKNTSTQGTEDETGTGLGLVLCKEFVEKHNGEIKIQSVLNEGSVFSFTVPNK